MLAWISNLFAPPAFVSPQDKDRVANLLKAIARMVVILTVGYAVVLTIVEPRLLPRMALAIPLVVLALVIEIIVRRGYLYFASGLLVGGMWVVLMYVTALNGGVTAVAYTGCGVVVLIAGMLLGRPFALLMAALSIIAGGLFVYANKLGLLSPNSTDTPASVWGVQAVFFISAALVLHLATSSIGEALARARAALIQREKLEAVQERRRALLEKVVELGKTVSQATDWHDCLERIYDSVRDGLDFDRAGLLIYDPVSKKMRSAVGTDRAGQMHDLWNINQTFESDPVIQNLLTGPADFKFTMDYSDSLGLTPDHPMYGVKNHAMVITWAGDDPVGILAVDNLLSARPMTDEQLEALKLFAGYVGLAIENSRLLAEAAEALAREQHFNEVTHAISSANDLRTLLSTVVHLTAQLVNADGSSLGLLTPNREAFTDTFHFNLPDQLQIPAHLSTRGISWDVIKTGRSVLVHNYPAHPQAVPDWVQAGTQDCLCVPLIAGDVCTGVLSLVTFNPDQQFSERDLALVEAVGRQAGVAIQKAQLFQQAQQRAEQLSILNEVGRAVSTLRDLPNVLEVIHQQVQRGLALDVFYVALYDHDSDEISFPVMFDDGQRWYREPGPLATTGLARQVIVSGQPLLENRTSKEVERPTPPAVALGNVAKRSASMLLAPIQTSQRTIGVISAQSYTLNAYSQEHLDFLVGLGHQTAIAIENARLFEAERQRVALLTALYETGLDVNAQLDLNTLLKTTGERALRLFNASLSGVYLMQPDNQTLELITSTSAAFGGEKIALGQGLAGRVAQSGEPLVIDDYSKWEGRASVYEAANFRSVIGVPIKWQGQVLGVIDVVDARPHRFKPEDIEAIGLLAAQAAVAIQNARLFDATQRQLEELRVLRGLAVAATEVLVEDELIERSTQIVGDALFQDYCGVLLVDFDLGVLRVHPSHRGMSESMKQTLIPLGQGITGLVAATGEPKRLADVSQEKVYWPANLSMRSELCVPLKAGDRVIGVLNVESPQPNAFTEADEHLLVTVAGQLAPAIERLRAEAQVHRLNTELERRVTERTAQLEAAVKELESFSYSVSHDLRAPLRSIDGFSQALLEDYGNQIDEEGRHNLEIVRHEVQRMGQLIDDLLNLARVTRTGMYQVEVDLSELANVLATGLHQKEPDRQVEFSIAPDLRVIGDFNLLRIMLDNLLSNAWKFTSRKPEGQIGMGREVLVNGENAFYIRDNGAGFDMAYVNKLFGAFQRLHSQVEFEGTGIGLATVQRIVTRHGGRIWATSTVDNGATFYFILPTDE
jgi:GAF domain-containing protein